MSFELVYKSTIVKGRRFMLISPSAKATFVCTAGCRDQEAFCDLPLLIPAGIRWPCVRRLPCFLLFLRARAGVDGAYFGTTFPHLFFMTYKGLVPNPPEKTFVPRVFGFRVHPRNLSGGRGAQARGSGEQHEQRLQERRRLRRPHPPPPQQPSGAAAPAAARQGGTGASAAAAAAVEACAGSSPARRARAAGGVGAGGNGRREGRAEGGSVMVRIKKEENWTKGRGGGAGRTGAGVEGAAAAATAGGAGDQQDVNGKKVYGGDSEPRNGGALDEARSAENGRQAR